MFYGGSVAVGGYPDQYSGQGLADSDSTTFPCGPAEADYFLENIDRGNQVVIFPRWIRFWPISHVDTERGCCVHRPLKALIDRFSQKRHERR